MNPHGFPHDRFRSEHICSVIHPNIGGTGIQIHLVIDPGMKFQGQDYRYDADTMGWSDADLDNLIKRVVDAFEGYGEDPEEEDETLYDEERDYPDPYDDDYPIDGVGFADPGGRSALRAATEDNPRDQPCPTCGRKNVLTPIDRQRGYQCDRCADRAEGRMGGDY